MKKEYRTIISAADGLELDVLVLMPEKPKAIFQIVHGMCEYKERYMNFMEYLCGEGFVVCIADIRGHGKSVKDEKDFGYFYDGSGNAAVDDVHQLTLLLKDEFKGLPITLAGHSMGSLIVRNYIRKYDKDIDKLVVMGEVSENPLVDVAIALVKIIGAIKGDRYKSKLMLSLSTGAYDKAYPEEGHNSWLSANRENVAEYNADPKAGFPFTINGYANLMTLLKRTYLKEGWAMEHKDLPIFFVSGKDDPCMENEEKFMAAVNFIKDRGYENVSYKLYKGMRHEVLNEAGKEEVYKDIAQFALTNLS